MRLFLKIKHWQLFILIVGALIITQITFSYLPVNRRLLFQLFNLPSVMPAMIVVLLWLYFVGINLYKILPPNIKMNLTLFKISLFLPFLYAFFVGFLFIKLSAHPVAENIYPDISLYFIILPLHLLSSLCILYSMYFNAKLLKSVELQRETNANEYIVEIILFAILAVGLWIIQPRLNKIFATVK